MNITINDCAIPVIDDEAYDFEWHVELWRIRGLNDFYPTKIIAEAAARLAFPDEDPDTRYGRISYIRMIPGDL